MTDKQERETDTRAIGILNFPRSRRIRESWSRIRPSPRGCPTITRKIYGEICLKTTGQRRPRKRKAKG
jgi:hypothetical protein